MLRFSTLVLMVTMLVPSLGRGEDIDVKWDIVPTGPGQKTKAFSAKTKLPEGAKVKITVVEVGKETDITFLDPFPKSGVPELKSVKEKGDKINNIVAADGKLTIFVPFGRPTKSDGNKLYFDNGLTLKVVVED